jgi:hypothetical protein
MGSPLWAPSGPGADPGWAPSPPAAGPTSRHGRAPSPPAAGPTAQPGWGPPPAASAPPQPATGWMPDAMPRGKATTGPDSVARDRGLRVAAGIMAIAAALVIVAASALPYVRLATGVAGHFESMSIFNAGPGSNASNLWFAVEPAGVALLGIILGVLLMVIRKGSLLAVAAGMLIAFGIQTVFLFLGYTLGLDFGTNKPGVAGAIGILGGLLLAGAGVMGAASRTARGMARA